MGSEVSAQCLTFVILAEVQFAYLLAREKEANNGVRKRPEISYGLGEILVGKQADVYCDLYG